MDCVDTSNSIDEENVSACRLLLLCLTLTTHPVMLCLATAVLRLSDAGGAVVDANMPDSRQSGRGLWGGEDDCSSDELEQGSTMTNASSGGGKELDASAAAATVMELDESPDDETILADGSGNGTGGIHAAVTSTMQGFVQTLVVACRQYKVTSWECQCVCALLCAEDAWIVCCNICTLLSAADVLPL